MRLVSKDAIAKFSNQSMSMQSMTDLFGQQPHHFQGYVRMKMAHRGGQTLGLLSIVEGMGNVFEVDPTAGRMTEISAYSFVWNVDVSQIPTVRFSESCNDSGLGGAPLTIILDDRFFSANDICALENTQQLFFMDDGERIADNRFRYTVRLVASKPTERIENRFTQARSTLRYVTNAHAEYSQRGTTKSWYNMEKHVNWMTKIRAGIEYSSDFRAVSDKYFMTESDFKKANTPRGGEYRVYLHDSIEQQVMDHFMISANNALLLGRSSMDEKTGRSNIQLIDNQDVIIGDGVIPQYERYAHWIDYSNNNLAVTHLQDAIENVVERRGLSQGNHITVFCNRRYHRAVQKTLQEQSRIFAPNGTWFYTKDTINRVDPVTKTKQTNVINIPNAVSVGASFNTYVYAGNTISFVVDESLTNHYRDRGYAIFIDTGLYESSEGKMPAVNFVTLKGRSMIKASVPGVGGITGTSSGSVSTALDASRYEILGWRGARVMNPYAATIIVENA